MNSSGISSVSQGFHRLIDAGQVVLGQPVGRDDVRDTSDRATADSGLSSRFQYLSTGLDCCR